MGGACKTLLPKGISQQAMTTRLRVHATNDKKEEGEEKEEVPISINETMMNGIIRDSWVEMCTLCHAMPTQRGQHVSPYGGKCQIGIIISSWHCAEKTNSDDYIHENIPNKFLMHATLNLA
ncbi:unnamed protein product [Dovyalis caffra]|uniref:Uncharacterized protein n=1 Tax=Dovyalis caffra TaxID=77055 RepID=A0AAV1RCU0_9ROSI|nr:unnamed protein product [Dovyalis caffra]